MEAREIEGGADECISMILKSKKIFAIIGAGVSVAAGIPSFRGPSAIDSTPGLRITSPGKLYEIMSIGIRTDKALCEAHCQLIAFLAQKAVSAKPTSFHYMLRKLDKAKILKRLYTQNIDGLESKVGFDLLDGSSHCRCITLRGSLAYLRCSQCSAKRSLESFFHLLKDGNLPQCPGTTRSLAALRTREKCGGLYPDIVLYGDIVQDETFITEAVNNDIKNLSENSTLLVVGTSLKIPGVLSILRSLGTAIRGKNGRVVYINIDPVPTDLSLFFDKLVVMDCQEFADKVVNAMDQKGKLGEELEEDVELREDLRPLWDWDWV